MELKFYQCEKCRKVLITTDELALDGWKELIAGTTEGAKEKHIPVVAASGNTVVVNVGSVTHPMSAEHLIEWVAVETEKGTRTAICTGFGKRNGGERAASGGRDGK